MKKTIFSIIITVCIVLFLWIAVFYGYKLYNSKIAKDNFDNNIKCQSVLEQLKNDYKSDVFSERDNYEIFFSPVENVCVWTYRVSDAWWVRWYWLVKIWWEHFEVSSSDWKCFIDHWWWSSIVEKCYYKTYWENEIKKLK